MISKILNKDYILLTNLIEEGVISLHNEMLGVGTFWSSLF